MAAIYPHILAKPLNQPAMSRIVRGLEPPYPKRGRAIADAVGWPGDWRELFERVEDGEVG